MAGDYDNNMTGILFREDEQKRQAAIASGKCKNPAEYSGTCEIDGKEYFINGWVKTSKKDSSRKFFSLLFRPKQENANNGATQTEQQPSANSDIPF